MTTLGAPPPASFEAEELEEVWEDAPGLAGFFTTVDHKRIGMRYVYTSFIFFFVAGIMALVMRAQLAQPDQTVVGAQTYNELFTVHGTTMIFFFNTPVLAGFGNYLVPLMLGTRDMAFPRLNAFSYWVFLAAGLFFFAGFLVGRPPDGGWFAYVPLTAKTYSPSTAIDFWGISVVFVGVSTTVGAVNFLVTVFKMRAPGMTFNRMPVFVWSMIVFSFMVVFAVPAVTLASALLELDRLFGTQFFAPGGGGSVLLYQHLFWFWGHPEVYILFVPATGMVSMIVPVFSRRPLAGYIAVVAALVSIGFISFGVWVHHMFATGLPLVAMSAFAAVGLIITIPSALQYFAWITTMWKGRVVWHTPMLFALGFLLIFLLGGITGVMVSVLPFDWQVTDSYFIVAHFHYVLNGAVVFPIFGALYYWLPKMTGRMLDDRLGKISFWTMFFGFNVTFFPMHILGFLGMPRRVYTYADGLGWGALNLLISLGALVFAAGVGITLFNFFWSRTRGAEAGPNPWGADSLEWATTSPPPDHNFTDIPVVRSRHPLWLGGVAPDSQVSGEALGIEGALDKETPVTGGLTTVPEEVMRVPSPTALPFYVAIGITLVLVGLLVDAMLSSAIGLAIGGVALARWLWHTEEDLS